MSYTIAGFTNQNVGQSTATSTTTTTVTATGGIEEYFQTITNNPGVWGVNDIIVRRTETEDGVRTITWWNGTTEITNTPPTTAPVVNADAIECGRNVVVLEATILLGTTVESLEDMLIRNNGGLPTAIPNTVDLVEISLNSGEIRSTVSNGGIPSYDVLAPSGRRTVELGQLRLIEESEVLNARFISNSTAELHIIFRNVALA